MSGWAQREAERKEDEANEMDELITENRELTAERDALRAELARLQRNEDCVQRLIVWAAENGWNGVDNSKILDSFIVGLFDQLRAELAAAKNRALIAEKQDERSRHLVCLWKDDREAQSKALSAMTAERDQLAADNARLRAALEGIAAFAEEDISELTGVAGQMVCFFCGYVPHEEKCPHTIATAALAATPAQSLAAHDAALLREVASKLFKEAEATECGTFYDAGRMVLAESDRREKEGA